MGMVMSWETGWVGGEFSALNLNQYPRFARKSIFAGPEFLAECRFQPAHPHTFWMSGWADENAEGEGVAGVTGWSHEIQEKKQSRNRAEISTLLRPHKSENWSLSGAGPVASAQLRVAERLQRGQCPPFRHGWQCAFQRVPWLPWRARCQCCPPALPIRPAL